MEALRWVLLIAGIIAVIGVYFWSRVKKRENNASAYDEPESVPSFSARNKEDENGWLDGVGPVRVVKKFNDEEIDSFNIDGAMQRVDDSEIVDKLTNTTELKKQTVAVSRATSEPEAFESKPSEENVKKDKQVNEEDVVVLYLVAHRDSILKGEKILSASFAVNLEYGEMDIFHRKDANGKELFAMANMMQPGSFDIDRMNELATRGVSLFTQLSLCKQPVEALDEMLISAHTLATLLNAQLCDQNRQLLNEAFTKSLREKAKYYADKNSAIS